MLGVLTSTPGIEMLSLPWPSATIADCPFRPGSLTVLPYATRRSHSPVAREQACPPAGAVALVSNENLLRPGGRGTCLSFLRAPTRSAADRVRESGLAAGHVCR